MKTKSNLYKLKMRYCDVVKGIKSTIANKTKTTTYLGNRDYLERTKTRRRGNLKLNCLVQATLRLSRRRRLYQEERSSVNNNVFF